MDIHIREFAEEHVNLLVEIVDYAKCDVTLAEHQLVKKEEQLVALNQELIQREQQFKEKEEELRNKDIELTCCQQKLRAIET